MAKVIDRRVQRTHKLLREALLALTLEKGYDNFTVQDLTDHANLGRATFYLHYRDKDELLIQVLEEEIDALGARINPLMEGLVQGDTTAIRIIFEHAEENRALYLILLRAQGALNILRDLRSYIAADFQHRIRALSLKPKVPAEVVANFLSSSLMGLLEWWLETDQPYSAEQITEMYYEVAMRAQLESMGIRPRQARGGQAL